MQVMWEIAKSLFSILKNHGTSYPIPVSSCGYEEFHECTERTYLPVSVLNLPAALKTH